MSVEDRVADGLGVIDDEDTTIACGGFQELLAGIGESIDGVTAVCFKRR